MKNIIRILIFQILILFIVKNIYAQNKQNILPTFTGKIQISRTEKSSFDSILVLYKRPFTPINAKYESIFMVADANGNFTFQLPKYNQPCLMQINLRHNGQYIRLTEHYLFEPTDNIKIEIIKRNNGDSVFFYGHGAEKYNLVTELDILLNKTRQEASKIKLEKPDSLPIKLLKFDKLFKGICREKEQLIENTMLSEKMKQIVRYEHGQLFSEWTRYLWYIYSISYKNNESYRSIIREYFKNNNAEFTYPFEEIMNDCPTYPQVLSFQEARRITINTPSDSISISTIYNVLKTKYSGILRERLIVDLLTAGIGMTPETKYNDYIIDSLMKDGERFIKTPSLKSFYFDKLRLSKGEKLFSASFQDQNGKLITTESLSGKVVLIDVWGIGCSWCAIFHQDFHKNAFPLFKDNKNFVYLSIGTDKKKERWIEGINSGKYTAQDYVNVNTGSISLDHPFFKYYDIQALPFIILVDKKGHIYSSNISESMTAIKLINSALNEF